MAGLTIWRVALTLMAGGATAQVLPLLLGPLLTRQYTAAQFGHYHLVAAVAANLAVVACARYEYALPVVLEDGEASALGALARWILLASTGLSALAGLVWALAVEAVWPLWLPLTVGSLGWLSLATLTATRARRFNALAVGRVLNYGGGAAAQAVAGAFGASLAGLLAGPALAAGAAATMLGGRQQAWWRTPTQALRDVAWRYRDFPLFNTPHAFMGALQDTASIALVAAWAGPEAAGFWGLTLRYLKAPASLIGSAVSQVLYPALAAGGGPTQAMRAELRRIMLVLALLALPLVGVLWLFGPELFRVAFGEPWGVAGDLARALALYVGVHFVASPLSVVTMAWNAQAWALRLALVGQVAFVAALAAGLWLGGLTGAGWAVSLTMMIYFGGFFWRLAYWPVASAAT